ncbi:MAG: hypothetical protein MR681_01620 [Prevotella sp.]|nr:hypothetical protein [Prevotella sp.]
MEPPLVTLQIKLPERSLISPFHIFPTVMPLAFLMSPSLAESDPNLRCAQS